jgi:hypothetical protein
VEDLLSLPQTTAKVNCKLHSQYRYLMFTVVVFLGQGGLVVGQEEESLCPWIGAVAFHP